MKLTDLKRTVVAFDSTKFIRGKEGNKFFGLIGVGLVVNRPESFLESYSSSIESLVKEYKKDRLLFKQTWTDIYGRKADELR